jgi:hypothetical protein
MENQPSLDSMNLGQWFDPPHICVYIYTVVI